MPPRLLFVDDDPENVDFVARTLRDALDADVRVTTTVEAAVQALLAEPFDVVVTDVFIPLDGRPEAALGPWARRHEELVEHLGGLVLLDEIGRLAQPPRILAHTACTDPALAELLRERVVERVRKPAPAEVLLDAVLRALREP